MSEVEIPSGATPEISSAQVAAQMKAVAHMARAIAKIHDDLREVGEQCPGLDLWAIWGEESASFMEILGDMLNGMDAIEDEDAWMAPVFAEAQRVWPRAAESWVPPHARAQASRDAAELARQREVIAGLRASLAETAAVLQAIGGEGVWRVSGERVTVDEVLDRADAALGAALSRAQAGDSEGRADG